MQDAKNNSAAIAELRTLLADSYTLYLKTQNFHWNVVGPRFVSLHQLFEEQYQELAAAVDGIAERIRALGEKSPGSFREFAELSDLEEAKGSEDAQAMIEALAADHRQLARQSGAVTAAAGDSDDEVTADLGNERRAVHENAAWMLSALLG